MRFYGIWRLGLFGVCIVGLGACSSLSGISSIFSGSEDDKDAIDKTGRIAMVSAEEVLTANPDLLSMAVILPDPSRIENWPQSGGNSSKAGGHILAGKDFSVDWKISAGRGSSKRNALTSTPVISDDHIFILDTDQKVRAFNLNTQNLVWSYSVPNPSKRDTFALGGGLAIADDKLIFASGYGIVTALNVKNGALIWQQNFDAPMTGMPTVYQDRIFVISNNNELFSLAIETGEVDWSDQAISESARILGAPSPAATEDLLVAPFTSGELVAYFFANGHRLWLDTLSRTGRFTPISAINDIAARPVLYGGLVIAASHSGVLSAIDGRSGQRVWALPLGSTQAPAIAGEFLFAVSLADQVACVELRTGQVVWVSQLPRFGKPDKQKEPISYVGPIIASNQIITISSEGVVYALSPQNGQITQTLDLKTPVHLEPIAAGAHIFVLSDKAELIAIK